MRPLVLCLVLLLSTGLSGCLGDDIWREPFVWDGAGEFGENQDAAQAFAAAFASLGDQGGDEGEVVVDSADDFPDSVYFENAKDFMNSQNPGSGDEFQDGVRVVTGNASDQYVTLTGEAADAYGQAAGPIAGTVEPITFTVPDRTTRLRWSLDVVLSEDMQSQEPGQNPTPVGTFQVRITDPRGAVRAEYHIDTTRHIDDQVFQGTWGDRSEVRKHLGGMWQVEVTADAEGAWSLVFDAYQPEYDDWEYWQFWRADLRGGSG